MSIHTKLQEMAKELRRCTSSTRARTALTIKRPDPNLVKVADLVAPLICEPQSNLQQSIRDFWEHMEARPHPLDASFAIKPGAAVSGQPDYLAIQLCVLLAQALDRKRRRFVPHKLAKRKISDAKLRDMASTALEQLRDNLSSPKLYGLLADALEDLEELISRGLRLDGAYLILDGKRIPKKLTDQSAVFIRVILESPGREASEATFRDKNINHPEQVKSRLICQDEFRFLNRWIHPDNSRGYYLRQP